MPDAKHKVLIVEDQYMIRALLTDWVEDFGMEVCAVASSAEDAITQALLHQPQSIIMDFRLEGSATGVDAALVIAKRLEARIIYVTGSTENSTRVRINEDHPYAILSKPLNKAELERVLKAA